MNYNVHNLVRIKTENLNNAQLGSIKNQIQYFLDGDDMKDDYDIIFTSNEYSCNNEIKYIDDIEGNDSFLDMKDKSCKLFRKGNILSISSQYQQILTPLIQEKLVQKNHSFIHASGLLVDGKSYIFAAAGGIGKTLISISLINNRKAKIFGDDLLIINDYGEIKSFPKGMSLYDYHLNYLEKLGINRTNKIKRQKKFTDFLVRIGKRLPYKNYIYNFLATRLPFIGKIIVKNIGNYVVVNYDELFTKDVIVNKFSNIDNLIFMERSNIKSISLEKVILENLIDKLIAIIVNEFYFFKDYYIGGSILNFTNFVSYLESVKNIYTKAFSGSDIYHVKIPEKMKIEDIIIFLEEHVIKS